MVNCLKEIFFFKKENPFILVILTLRITLHLPYSEEQSWAVVSQLF